MEVKNSVRVTKEDSIYADQESAALFTDDVGDQEIKPEISRQSTVAFTERERLWEGMK